MKELDPPAPVTVALLGFNEVRNRYINVLPSEWIHDFSVRGMYKDCLRYFTLLPSHICYHVTALLVAMPAMHGEYGSIYHELAIIRISVGVISMSIARL